MQSDERLAIIQLAARYQQTLRRIETAGQLEAVLRLRAELSTVLPSDQAELFDQLLAVRGSAIPRPRRGD